MPDSYHEPLDERKSGAEMVDDQRTSDVPMTPEDCAERRERLRRRMAAAMMLAGIPNVAALAKRCEDLGYTSGFSAGTLETMRSGKRSIQPDEIPVLAEACGLPPLFFSIDFETLEEPTLRHDVDVLKVQVANLMESALRAERAISEWERRDRPAGRPQDEER